MKDQYIEDFIIPLMDLETKVKMAKTCRKWHDHLELQIKQEICDIMKKPWMSPGGPEDLWHKSETFNFNTREQQRLALHWDKPIRLTGIRANCFEAVPGDDGILRAAIDYSFNTIYTLNLRHQVSSAGPPYGGFAIDKGQKLIFCHTGEPQQILITISYFV